MFPPVGSCQIFAPNTYDVRPLRTFPSSYLQLPQLINAVFDKISLFQ
jgi:hypothetical protein